MRFVEIDILGVLVAPLSVMIVVAWVLTIVFQRVAAHHGLMRYVWHPALFLFAIFMILLSILVLIEAR